MLHHCSYLSGDMLSFSKTIFCSKLYKQLEVRSNFGSMVFIMHSLEYLLLKYLSECSGSFFQKKKIMNMF